LKKLMADYAATGLPPAYILKVATPTSQDARASGGRDHPDVEER